MDVNKIKDIQGAIVNHQNAVLRRGGPFVPGGSTGGSTGGHNVYDEDLSKVMSNDVIGKSSFDPTEALRK
jgi:hypothetical protein